MLIRRFLILLLLSFTPFAVGEDETKIEPEPEAEFKSPAEGDEVDHVFTARGRTRHIPDGFVPMLFQVNPKDDFPLPSAPPFDANRTFSETIYFEEHDIGPRTLELHILPEADAEKLAEWRQALIEWYESGQDPEARGPEPAYDPTWMHNAIGINAVAFVIKN
ncbi:MAG: hypothetical protein AAGD22_10490 [Verrucomicrobiota bacterium]